MSEEQQGFTIVLLIIATTISVVGWFIRYLLQQNKNLQDEKNNTIIQELQNLKASQEKTNELILTDKITFSVLVERVDTLEKQTQENNNELRQIKAMIKNEAELKLMIKEAI